MHTISFFQYQYCSSTSLSTIMCISVGLYDASVSDDVWWKVHSLQRAHSSLGRSMTDKIMPYDAQGVFNS